MKPFRASQSSVAHIEAVLTSNQFPVWPAKIFQRFIDTVVCKRCFSQSFIHQSTSCAKNHTKSSFLLRYFNCFPSNHTVGLKESSRQRPRSAMSRKTPGEVRARTCGTKSPSRSEALRFIDSSNRLGDLVPQVRAWTSPGVFRDMALLGLCLELSFSVLYCRTQANLPTLMHFAEPAIWPSSIGTEDPTCANHVDVLTVWSVFPSNVHINILRGLPCRLESLRLKFTNEPSIFVDGDLDESIKRSASDRLGDLVPQVRARTSPGVFRDMALLGLCLELSFSVLYCRTQANLPTLTLWDVES